MVPAPDADKEALLRRATYDLIGLPPTPQEVQAFVGGQHRRMPSRRSSIACSPRPHYGERWGRYWLDTARYSDTIGGDGTTQRTATTVTPTRGPIAIT